MPYGFLNNHFSHILPLTTPWLKLLFAFRNALGFSIYAGFTGRLLVLGFSGFRFLCILDGLELYG